MNQQSGNGFSSAAVLSVLLITGTAQAASTECDEAWASYNEFKSRTTMEAAQYPLTVQAAAVRAACGKEALPAPADADINPVRPRVRTKPLPPKPPQPSDAPKPSGP